MSKLNFKTDSSKELRSRLQKDYVTKHEVLNSYSFDKYIAYAWKLHAEAEQNYKRKDYANAYILYHSFGKFVTESLPKHNAYGFKQYSRDVNQLKQAFKTVLVQLDFVNAALDQEEDERLIHEELEGGEDALPEYLTLSTPKPTYRPSITQLPLIPQSEAAGMRSSRNSDVSRVSNTGRDSLSDPPLRSKSQASAKSGSGSPVNTLRSKSATGPNADVDRLSKAFAMLRPETGVPVEREPERTNPYSDLYSTTATVASSSDSLLSVQDYEILRRLRNEARKFYIPMPIKKSLTLQIGNQPWFFHRDDFSVTFSPFFHSLPPDLQLCRSAIETNRCFFIHLGVAMGVHPFVLELVLRYLARRRRRVDTVSGDQGGAIQDVLSTLEEYAGMVDANCLCFLWPREFSASRICVISGSDARPVFSVFSVKGKNQDSLRDVIIHCDGSHFTLLRPITPPSAQTGCFKILTPLLDAARASGHIVLVNEVEADDGHESSIDDTIAMLLRST